MTAHNSTLQQSARHALDSVLNEALSATPSLTERIRLIRELIPGRITFSTSLGLEDQAVLHAIAEAGAEIDIFTLDTGRHFAETLGTIAESEAHYGLPIRLVHPEAGELDELIARDGVLGFRKSLEQRKACCNVRKVKPLSRALAGASAWITGLRRTQSGGRLDTPFAEIDPGHGLIKVSPIADWSLETLESFVAANEVPVNPLHEQGFPSIGCSVCTRAVRPGEDIRAGRWWWESPEAKECGLHGSNRDASRKG